MCLVTKIGIEYQLLQISNTDQVPRSMQEMSTRQWMLQVSIVEYMALGHPIATKPSGEVRVSFFTIYDKSSLKPIKAGPSKKYMMDDMV